MDVKKAADGKWYSKGKPFDRFSAVWAPGEPSNAGDYAVLAADVGYKLKAADGLVARPFYCMADKPVCPDGYDYVPEFGIGTSCFKLVPTTYQYQTSSQGSQTDMYDVTVGEYNCLMEKTRLAVIDDVASREALKTWYMDKEPLLTSSEVLRKEIISLEHFKQTIFQKHNIMMGIFGMNPYPSSGSQNTFLLSDR